ncbi:Dehydroquinate synthase-like protein [Bimuria novae-zelandiae CBS 107.79]|uniref:Dehydroquinate synthase-like protein n=1 Tax=Bimuria novae-zelandiae CBS 107.79 TaxID=1447943 RepID=A0A6A5VSP0_9PLEO|nr:Dehydroquinate synthase-like protein [Bimuria novae-zelandiae CBS 107.79]
MTAWGWSGAPRFGGVHHRNISIEVFKSKPRLRPHIQQLSQLGQHPASGTGRFSTTVFTKEEEKDRSTKRKMTDATYHPMSGLWQPTQIQKLHYGPDSVQTHLLGCLPLPSTKAFIITGKSLATKTPLVKQVEELLGGQHAGTFSNIGEHAPVAQLDEATSLVSKDGSIDTVISIGGGSPIDSAKAVSHRLHEKNGNWLHHIAIPTTLSASECTMMAGFTQPDGVKTGVRAPQLVPHVVLYDATFAVHTPERLFTSTGMRALDHAVELLYHPTAAEMPARWTCLQAAGALFEYLPKYKKDPKDQDTVTKLQLAAFASLGFLGTNLKGGLGLSHGLGYALGSPYGIPHGITSCLTLGHVVKLKAGDPASAEQVARLLPFIGESRSGDDRKDAEKVGDRVLQLVRDLELDHDLRNYKVGKDQIPVITKRASGQEEGELYKKVEALL